MLRHPELWPGYCSVTQFRKLPPSNMADCVCVCVCVSIGNIHEIVKKTYLMASKLKKRNETRLLELVDLREHGVETLAKITETKGWLSHSLGDVGLTESALECFSNSRISGLGPCGQP